MMYENLHAFRNVPLRGNYETKGFLPFDAVNVINFAFSLGKLRESVRTRQSSRNPRLRMAKYSAFSTTHGKVFCIFNY